MSKTENRDNINTMQAEASRQKPAVKFGEPNFDSRTIFTGDNLHVMRGMNDACIDVIYLDPPFNSEEKYGEIFDPEDEEKKAIFKDIWTLHDVDLAWWGEIKKENEALYKYLDAVRGIHSPGLMSYLIYMSVRLLEMKRLLTPTGSIYLHCDWHASHYLKSLMDAIFGKDNFRNEIVWCYRKMPNKIRGFQRNHDVVLFYTKSDEFTFNPQYGEMTAGSLKTFESGKKRGYNANNSKKMVTVFNWDKYNEAVKSGKIPNDLKPVEFKGGKPLLRDWWDDIKILGGPNNKERITAGKYPTLKPLALLKRIILASSNEEDMVLDPFCGCATTCVAAEDEGRQWVGIDISPEAANRVKKRITSDLFHENFNHLTTLPIKTDEYNPKEYKTRDNLIILYGRQAGYCFLCFKWKNAEDMSIDHIIPQSKNGSNRLDNLQMLCHKCNSRKGNKTYEQALAIQFKEEGAVWEHRKHEAELEIKRALGQPKKH